MSTSLSYLQFNDIMDYHDKPYDTWTGVDTFEDNNVTDTQNFSET